MAAAPREVDGYVVFLVVEVDPPEGLGNKVLDSKVSVDHES
jgi:hypothetical protein